MFEKFTSQDANDFRQRYQGTYGYYRRGTKKKLVRLDKVDTDNRVVIFVDSDDLQYEVHADASDDTIGFDFLPPEMSYHNTSSGVYLLRRIPARQYSRGISDRNVSIRTLNGRGVPVNFSTLTDIFENTVSPSDIFDSLINPKNPLKATGLALSSQFGVWLEGKVVYCFNDRIGDAHLSSKGLQIELEDYSFWGTEVKNALSRSNIKGTVS